MPQTISRPRERSGCRSRERFDAASIQPRGLPDRAARRRITSRTDSRGPLRLRASNVVCRSRSASRGRSPAQGRPFSSSEAGIRRRSDPAGAGSDDIPVPKVASRCPLTLRGVHVATRRYATHRRVDTDEIRRAVTSLVFVGTVVCSSRGRLWAPRAPGLVWCSSEAPSDVGRSTRSRTAASR